MRVNNLDRQKLLSTCFEVVRFLGKKIGRRIPRDYDIVLNLQYCNETIIDGYIDFWITLLEFVDPKEKIINLGSGSGIIERIARDNGINMSSSDFDENVLHELDVFPVIRKLMGVPLDIVNNKVDEDNFKIQTEEKFDTMLISRFSLFKEKHVTGRKITDSQIKTFFDEFERVADKIYYCEFEPNVMRPDVANYAKSRYNVKDYKVPIPTGRVINIKEISKL